MKKATFAMRALSVQGPKIRNELRNNIKMQVTLDSFKAKLKTFLFKEPTNAKLLYLQLCHILYMMLILVKVAGSILLWGKFRKNFTSLAQAVPGPIQPS